MRPPLGLPGRGPRRETCDGWQTRLSVCSVGKKYVLGASEPFKISFEFMLRTRIDACIAVGVVLLLVLVLLSLLIAKNESLLVLPLALALLLQLILILVLVVAPVRVSILVLRPIPILESKIDIGTVPAVVPILLIPTSARVVCTVSGSNTDTGTCNRTNLRMGSCTGVGNAFPAEGRSKTHFMTAEQGLDVFG